MRNTIIASQCNIFNENRFSACIHNPHCFLCHFIKQEIIGQTLKLQAKEG